MTSTTRNGRTGRVLVRVAATVALVLAGTGAAYGVMGLSGATDAALRDRGSTPSPVSGKASTPGASPSQAPSQAPSESPSAALPSRSTAPSPTLVAVPEPVLEPGDTGVDVRELQSRLAQLAWFGVVTVPAYGPETRDAVSGFQAKRGFEATGVVDKRTWDRLVAMTREPTRTELFNRPGPTLLGPGAHGPQVRELEVRLRQIAWFFGDVDDTYDATTREAVSGFQRKRGVPTTGAVDQRTLSLLEAMSTEPNADELANRKPTLPDPSEGAPLDPRCATGAVLCIDKSSLSLRWVVDGRTKVTVDVRFGSAELPTREGQFSVYRKSRDHVSSLFNTSMPFAMFFSGGQAVHYSPDFAAHGYDGASHGCVNVRDYDAVASLFDQVPVGTPVVVYRS